MKALAIGLLLFASTAAAQPAASPVISKHVEKILSRADGTSQATAYKVSSVSDEYDIIKALGLEMKSQALVVGKKPYDLITAIDRVTGTERQVWFDISSFYPEF